LNGAFHLAKILHNADIEINEEIDTFLQSVECLASMPQKDCNLWLKGVQSFWLASTEKV
jgi:hypothetical protein